MRVKGCDTKCLTETHRTLWTIAYRWLAEIPLSDFSKTGRLSHPTPLCTLSDASRTMRQSTNLHCRRLVENFCSIFLCRPRRMAFPFRRVIRKRNYTETDGIWVGNAKTLVTSVYNTYVMHKAAEFIRSHEGWMQLMRLRTSVSGSASVYVSYTLGYSPAPVHRSEMDEWTSINWHHQASV
jgi:hypothetical protein